MKSPLRLSAVRSVLFAALLPGAVSAHVGAGAGDTDVLPRPSTPEAVLLEAPWGLVVSADGAQFEWICHEVLSNGVAELPEFEVSSSGVLLGVSGLLTGTAVEGESLYRSVDGCSWDPVAGTTGRVIQDAAFDPEDAAVAVGVTADAVVQGEPIAGSIFRSTDGGLSFTEVETYAGRLFREVRFGGGGRVYALAVQQDPLAALLMTSPDAGLTWTEIVVPDDDLESPAFGVIAAVDPADPDEVWLTFDGNSIDGALRSVDGGSTLAPVTLPATSVLDLTLLPNGEAWMVGGDRQLFSSSDRVTWQEHSDAPQVWGGASGNGGMLFAVNTLAHDEALSSTVDGESFTTVLSTLDLQGPLACPADSTVAQVCEPLWEDMLRTLTLMRPQPSGDDDDDSAPVVEPNACDGCDAGGGSVPGSGWLVLAGLLGLARRRRGRAS